LFAALISQCDLYAGYDSAFQHIAAALGLPCIDIFAGFSSPRMVDRWRPTGARKAAVLDVDTLNSQPNTDAILSKILALAGELH
jgi:ADP-heptose:LPS heptosyltransferase